MKDIFHKSFRKIQKNKFKHIFSNVFGKLLQTSINGLLSITFASSSTNDTFTFMD